MAKSRQKLRGVNIFKGGNHIGCKCVCAFVLNAFCLRAHLGPHECRDVRIQAEECSLTGLRSPKAEFRDTQATPKWGRIPKKGKTTKYRVSKSMVNLIPIFGWLFWLCFCKGAYRGLVENSWNAEYCDRNFSTWSLQKTQS